MKDTFFQKYFSTKTWENPRFLWGTLIILMLSLLFSNLSTPGMFMDGLIYAVLGKNFALQGGWPVPSFTPHLEKEFFDHPPYFFYFMSKVFNIFGISWASARVSGIIFSALTVISLPLLIKRKLLGFLSSFILLLCLSFLKKSRFPNMDLPLIFFLTCSSLFYFKFYCSRKYVYALIAGLFFGSALLVKGIPALLLLPGLGLFFLFKYKEWDKKFVLGSVLCLITGLIIFCHWPATLYFNDKFYGFEKWVSKQIVGTVAEGRAVTENHYFFYLKHLFIYAGPWILLFFLSLFKRIRNSTRPDLELLCQCIVIGFLIPLSLMKWKLSHYILPIYPFLAITVAFQLKELMTKEKVIRTFQVFTVLGSLLFLVYLITPLGSEIRRDKKLFTVIEKIQALNIKPNKISIVDRSLPGWSSIGVIEFSLDKVKSGYFRSSNLDDNLKEGEIHILLAPSELEDDRLKLLFAHQGLFVYQSSIL